MKNYLVMISGTYCGEPEEAQSFEQPYKLFEGLDEAVSAANEYVKNSTAAEQFPGTDTFGYLNSYFMAFTARVVEMSDVPTIIYKTWSDIEFIPDERKTKNVILSHTDERIEYPHRP